MKRSKTLTQELVSSLVSNPESFTRFAHVVSDWSLVPDRVFLFWFFTFLLESVSCKTLQQNACINLTTNNSKTPYIIQLATTSTNFCYCAHAYNVPYTMQEVPLMRNRLHATEGGPTPTSALFRPSSLVFVFHSTFPNSQLCDFCRTLAYWGKTQH